MKDATKVLRAGLPDAKQGEPLLPGPTFASLYHTAGDPASSPFTYARYSNPTWVNFENALGELEDAKALVFPSGMATVSAVFGALLRPGDTFVMPSDSYFTCRLLADGYFKEIGVRAEQAPTRDSAQAAHLAGAKLVWLETPSNPQLECCDIRALCDAAHRAGALVAVDNTTATILGQRPLDLGADLCMAADTKALTGHSDLVLGHVATRDQALYDKLKTWRTQIGAIAGPFEVWLAHRSLATFHLRYERQCANALAIAQFLTARGDVQSVRYPGLVGDAAHAVAAKQMHAFGPVVSFTLASRAKAEAFFRNTQLITEATSFGGVHTSAERRARWGGDAVPEGFVRLSAGCEAIEDLLADLAQALDRA